MLNTVRVRCSKCEYENDPQYHYCGMCGELLPDVIVNPAPRPQRVERADASAEIPTRPTRVERPDVSPVARPVRIERPDIVASRPTTPIGRDIANTAPLAPTTRASSLHEERDSQTSDRDNLAHDNLPRHRATHEPETPRERTVSGPSFLGLSNEPSNDNFQYLLEDPEAGSHRGRYLILFLLVALGLALGWQWRHGGFPFGGRLNSQSAANSSPSISPSPNDMSASPSEVAPAMEGDGRTASHPKTGVGDEPQPVESKPANSAVPKPTEREIGSSQPASSAPSSTPAAKGKNEAQAESAAEGRDETSQPHRPPSEKPAEKAAMKEAVEPKEQPKTSEASRTTPEKIRKTPVSTEDDALTAEGEKYLYGHGVPQNCNRAQRDLLTAGEHSNARAQSMLGAMYATGHCATRDLPTAYRWFAKSLRTDPSNTRLSRNLEILWNQMTPDEKQVALRSAH